MTFSDRPFRMSSSIVEESVPVAAPNSDRVPVVHPPRERVGDKWFWTFDHFIAELDNPVGHLELREKRFYPLDQSWGGILAGMFASRRPEGLRTLVIAGLARELPPYRRGRQATAGSAVARSVQDAGGRRLRRQL
ncbi:hypothetical protein DL766_010027 [Monosporascus sp. MC13-8B]|uniref:Uncharacterized protein n=1 Tax=Monosporascus cannonballus TaxID=155416 RepID=A0ABY0HBW9_9PEZI|nr:hypothetical protein DL763_008721 [Monosporascus cannonballus]RYO87776.1 hypothetical protein DL762_004066 [Monosporascus cannonballus]RYP11602.1 hypothetical protein DL766_010027 [Monosporascus sp. MC13-8B]